MNIEEEKSKFLKDLEEVETEARMLLERIEKAKSELPKVMTKEDAEKFTEENDIEEGLERIMIF